MEVVGRRRAKKRFIYPFPRLIKLTYLVCLISLSMMLSIKFPNDSVQYPFQVKLWMCCLKVTLMVGISGEISGLGFLGKAFLYSLNNI